MEELHGIHQGTLTVSGRALLINGIINGDLKIEGESQVDFEGIVRGSVELHGGSLHLRGIVKKNVDNDGGKLTIRGLVKGRVRTHSGETVIQERSLIGCAVSGS